MMSLQDDETPDVQHRGDDVSLGEDISPDTAFHLERLTEVLVATASGSFDVRAPRSHRGDPWDVLAFLVNETAEEVQQLVVQLRSEREKLDQAIRKLNQTEKLAALGEMARGIAHELNQPLTVMQSLAELLLEKPERTVEERRKEIELIAAAARRMGRIVQGVRTFGRQAPLQRSRLDLFEPWGSALSLMEEPLRLADVEVISPDRNAGLFVYGDSEALSQVFVNLLSNARDVLENLAPGVPRTIELTVETNERDVSVRFRDSGPGIPKDVAGRIFDPFFSTKTVGRGTGLGLAICQGIMFDHGGCLLLENPGDAGARFLVGLPLYSAEME